MNERYYTSIFANPARACVRAHVRSIHSSVTEGKTMRVENMTTRAAGRTTARVYLQASRTPKTNDAFKRAASWERSVRKAFEYRGWIVDAVENIMPVDDSQSILDVIVILKNNERVDALRECKRWNVKTQSERVVSAIYERVINAYDVLIDAQNERIAIEHDKRSALYARLFAVA